ncbi:MAG: Nramp family divalent metal transporter, partial [Armatimonadetes bacterium]|nr:Nramp family divalent metal transporter [Armatimonadota bacterium]
MGETEAGTARGWVEPLPEQQPADLPPKELSFWKLAGPGAVLVGLSIGAGEIVVWPRLVAQHGEGIVWAAVLGVFIQLWINLEVGRWTVCTGESVFTGFRRLWLGTAPLFILFTILGWLAPGWARVSGSSLKALLVGPDGWGSDPAWTGITFALVVLVLFGPKMVYQSVEKVIEVLVVIVVVGLICVAVAVGTGDSWRALGTGLLSVGYVPAGLDVKKLFIAVVFAGAGGTANLFYTFYLRDKQIGMGARMPMLQNPLRGRSEAMPAAGFRFTETAENVARFRDWFRYVCQDQWLFFFFLNALTILLFIFGSLAVLYPQHIVPAEGRLIWDEAAVLGQVWGRFGTTVFLLVGFATLFSTQLALVDGVARSLSDIVYTNFRHPRRRELSWWYM